MWIEKTKNGLRAVERFNVNGKWKRFTVPIERDTPQARRRAKEALEEKSRAICQSMDETPLKSLIDEYLETKDCRESTRINLRVQFKNVEDILGDGPVGSYTPGTVMRCFRSSKKPPQTVNRAIVAFKTFSAWLFDSEYTETDIGSRLHKVKEMEKEKLPEELYIERDRLAEILSNLSGMPYYLTKFLALTGMRIGEATALTMDDIGDKYITVNKAYSSHSHEITLPKNRSSIRDIYIQPELRKMLDEFLRWRKLFILANGIRPDYLFCTSTGNVYQERYYRIQLARFGAHPHMLRHTHVALLAEQGIPLEVISRRLGHNGTAVTKSVYYHVTERQREKDEQMISEAKIL